MARPEIPTSVAFLLAQLGQRAADRFAERVSELDLIPPQAGILRAIWVEPGRSQQALSAQLGLLPSRVVSFVDDLEKRGFVERQKNPTDRRLHALHLTAQGESLMGEIAKAGMAHEAEFTADMSPEQVKDLTGLLAAMAERLELVPGVHPGVRNIGRSSGQTQPETDTAAG